eukprot:gnl/TRDRNA2_/TRDRNA2_167065_c1_seq2.p2 gnl/TRDRNA2_/TRDRNA2_167065_c1~~gnl/TRDRNA2_/TRDRNA2_167065_c1_seq2.p2  ORF type:complete len:156 (+),score=35.99 gnl/TRDRNA2_/TRDRNA2_167065_c1_seq2:37-504(+)
MFSLGLTGATAAVLMDHAVEVRGVFESGVIKMGADLLKVIEQFDGELDVEVLEEARKACSQTSVVLLHKRIIGVRSESCACRRLCISLYESLLDLESLAKAKGTKPAIKVDTFSRKVAELVRTTQTMIMQIFQVVQHAWSDLEEPRRHARGSIFT